MKRFTFGMPEKMVPSRFCDGFRYVETGVNYPAANFTFKKIPSGCVLEFPIEDDCHIFGFGLQLKQFDHRGRKLRLDVNADPVGADGESHAPVPFFVTNKGILIPPAMRNSIAASRRIPEKMRQSPAVVLRAARRNSMLSVRTRDW